MRDTNGKSIDIDSANNRSQVKQKQKPVKTLTPSQKNVPKSNISSEMEMGDLSINKSAIEKDGGRNFVDKQSAKKIDKQSANENEGKAKN